MKQTLMIAQFPWVGNQTLDQHIELTKHNRERLRAELSSHLYWVQRDRKIWWNLRLVKTGLGRLLLKSAHRVTIEAKSHG